MAEDDATWTVRSPSALAAVDTTIWTATDEIPGMPLERRMVVVRLRDGRLVVHSPICLDAEAMEHLEAWGTPSFIVVPNGYHRMDAPAWKARYPEARVVCPEPARRRVSKVVSVDGSWATLPETEGFRAEPLEGSKAGEGVLIVRCNGRLTLVFNDTLFNQPHLPGPKGWMLRLAGSTGPPKVTGIARMFLIGDRNALRSHLLRLAELEGLARIVPGHGDVIADDPAGTLRRVAEAL